MIDPPERGHAARIGYLAGIFLQIAKQSVRGIAGERQSWENQTPQKERD
jgi:hypothetical protein